MRAALDVAYLKNSSLEKFQALWEKAPPHLEAFKP
jgi:hypothetical protein